MKKADINALQEAPVWKTYVQRYDGDGAGGTYEVPKRDIPEILENPEFQGKNLVSLYIYDKAEVTIDGVEFVSKEKKNPKTVYVGGILTEAEFAKDTSLNERERSYLASAFENAANYYTPGVLFKRLSGGLRDLEKGAIVVDVKGNQLWPKIEADISAAPAAPTIK